MAHSPLLGPVVTLVAWTLVMLVWMAVTRAGAAKKAGIDLGTNRGGRGQDLDGVVAAQTRPHRAREGRRGDDRDPPIGDPGRDVLELVRTGIWQVVAAPGIPAAARPTA